MKLPAIELLVEFAVILLAPIIHNYYLWKFKKVEKKELVRNIKIFAGLYALLAFIGLLVLF
jgi:hypothetical protein